MKKIEIVKVTVKQLYFNWTKYFGENLWFEVMENGAERDGLIEKFASGCNDLLIPDSDAIYRLFQDGWTSALMGDQMGAVDLPKNSDTDVVICIYSELEEESKILCSFSVNQIEF